jgi:hypothetical protein
VANLEQMSPREQKIFAHKVLAELWRKDYQARFAQELSWERYLEEVFQEIRRSRRRARLHAELKRWNDLQALHKPLFTWLLGTSGRHTPYVCGTCGSVEEMRKPPLFVFQTMGVWFTDETRSRYLYTGLSCLQCGNSTKDGEPYLPRSGDEFRPPTEFHRGREHDDWYALSYTVSYGEYVGHRRQVRKRHTHELLDTRAEAVRFFEARKVPNLAKQEFSDLKVDGVLIVPDHPLYAHVITPVKEYEAERMAKFP